MDKPPTDEITRAMVEAERKAKRAAKQERKKAALEKLNTDGLGNQQKSVKSQSSEPSKDRSASEPIKEIKPKLVSTLKIHIHLIIALD